MRWPSSDALEDLRTEVDLADKGYVSTANCDYLEGKDIGDLIQFEDIAAELNLSSKRPTNSH